MAIRPIIVMGCARSGTSLIAGILYYHGAWTGRCRQADERNPRGFFENRRINRLVYSAENMNPNDFSYAIRRILRKEKYPGGPWLVKHGVIPYWHVWKRFSPIWVLVRRKSVDILRSQRLYCMQAENIRENFKIMDEIRDARGGFDIHPDKIINGDYSELEQLMSETAMELTPTIIDQFVDKELWHQ